MKILRAPQISFASVFLYCVEGLSVMLLDVQHFLHQLHWRDVMSFACFQIFNFFSMRFCRSPNPIR